MFKMILNRFWECYEESVQDLDDCDEISILFYGFEEESEIDNFKNFEAAAKKSEEILFSRVDVRDQKIHNKICYAILYVLRFDKDGSKDKCDKTQFQTSVDCDLIENLLGNLNLILIYKNLITY